ncbi:hypothetical protein QUF74_15475 [Candidatus Halobeggiatoa sp. HSG11]|nr:hypothetical protein [Candidatus Halobeggiatoa sp. HSG11]
METEVASAKAVAETIDHAMTEFNTAMKRREALIVRIATQTTQIIKFSMIGLGVLTVTVFALIIILLSDMGDITKRLDDVASYMHEINENIVIVGDNITGMTGSINLVKGAIDKMDKNVAFMPTLNTSVTKISSDMVAINNSINKMTAHIDSLTINIDEMGINMAIMTHQVGNLNNSLGIMGHNVDRIAAPIKMFPFP